MSWIWLGEEQSQETSLTCKLAQIAPSVPALAIGIQERVTLGMDAKFVLNSMALILTRSTSSSLL
jgi:hypothetical protein